MPSRLSTKLIGAFLLVIAVGAVVISLLISAATSDAFTLYTTRSGQAMAQQLAPLLAEYYAQANNWQGVDVLLQEGLDDGMGNAGMMGQGHGQGPGRQGNGDMMGGMDQRRVLADADGVVVADTQGELAGQKLPARELQYGAPVMLEGRQVGTVLVTPNDFAGSGTPAGEFLASVNRAVLSSVIIAALIALVLGAVLAFQITAPLRQLKKAAAAIAQGDLSQRVHIRSRDELGDLGQTFNQMAESLSTAEIQRQHLAADVAHELRTPLAAIQGTLEGMQDGVLPLDEEQVAALHAETSLLNRLVGDLRLLSLAEAGQLKLEIEEGDPGPVLRQIVERARAQANLKNIQLETAIPDGLPVIRMDADRVTQVLNNLLNNALRHTPEGGQVRVTAAFEPRQAELSIAVEDSGPGIAAQDLPFVFDRFYRADPSRTRASGGSGLGLAIVKQLVAAHGGKVQAESPIQDGHGTRIIFSLPVN